MLLWQIDTVKALNILLWQSINKGNENIIIFYYYGNRLSFELGESAV